MVWVVGFRVSARGRLESNWVLGKGLNASYNNRNLSKIIGLLYDGILS